MTSLAFKVEMDIEADMVMVVYGGLIDAVTFIFFLLCTFKAPREIRYVLTEASQNSQIGKADDQ